MTPSEILTAARELISVPERWTQGDYAKDKDGRSCLEDDEGAVCYCSVGAISKVRFSSVALEFLAREAGGYIPDFNDTHTHAEVIAAFDRAIAAAKERGQ
jgi:hypothetical protein